MASEVIKLNLIPSGEMPTYHCSQFDKGRLILIDLFNGEDEYSLPAGYTAELHTRKMDNNIVTLATTSVSSNHLTFTSTEQLTACAGNNLSEVSIKDASDYVVGTLNFWLYVEKDPLAGGLISTSSIHDLTDQIEEITTEIVGENYYNKTETDDLLDLKADKSTTYTKTEVNTLLNSKADASSVYTKSETNTLLSAKADADDVYTKSQVETKLAAKADANSVYTKSETDTLLSAKADANGVYNKVEVDAMVDDLEDAIDLKADQSTTYTKTQVDNALALKADAATTYTKTEVDTALALKANAADVYTKTEVDNIILDIMPVDTASGPIATFDTELAVPLVNVSCNVVATGGNGTPDNPIPINGYTEANITRCGVNLINLSDLATTGITYSSGDLSGTAGAFNTAYDNGYDSGHAFNANTQYTVSMKAYTEGNASTSGNGLRVGFIYTDGTKNYLNITNDTTTETTVSYTSTSGKTVKAIYFTYGSASANIWHISDLILAEGTTATYSAYNGQTYTIAFGQTVYGGVLDVTRGKLHVTYTETLIKNLSWTKSTSANKRFYTLSVSSTIKRPPTQNDVGDSLCEIGSTISANYLYSNHDGIAINTNGEIWLYFTDYVDKTAEEMITDLGDYKIVFALDTPFDIDLTPEVISAVVGTNNVYSDTNGNTTVKFKDSIQHYIDTHTGG